MTNSHLWQCIFRNSCTIVRSAEKKFLMQHVLVINYNYILSDIIIRTYSVYKSKHSQLEKLLAVWRLGYLGYQCTKCKATEHPVIQCVALILRSTKFNPHFYKKTFGNAQTLLLRLVDREYEASDSARLYANVLGDGAPAYRDLGQQSSSESTPAQLVVFHFCIGRSHKDCVLLAKNYCHRMSESHHSSAD